MPAGQVTAIPPHRQQPAPIACNSSG